MTEHERRALRTATVVATAVLVTAALVLYLPDILMDGPVGLHYIRQTDSISFIQRFGHTSWNFFAPAVHDLRNCPDDGATAAEFPALYYLTALLGACFGAPFSVMRILSLAFVIGGHVMLARTATRMLGSMVTGIAFSLWMFSSSVVIYYGANYLPDATMYGCVLIGACFAIEACAQERRALSLSAMAFLFAAGLLKAPATLYLIAYLVLGVFSRTHGPITHIADRRTLIGIFMLVIIAAWHAYAIRYNHAHHTHYFMTWSEPVWSMAAGEFMTTWAYVRDYWWTKYHHPSSWHVLLVLCAVLLFRLRRLDRTAMIALGLLVIAGSAFVVLFFRKLRDHDYYFLTVAPIICGIALAGLSALRGTSGARWMKGLIAAATIVLALMGLDLGRLNLARRYRPGADRYTASRVLGDRMTNTLNELGVPSSARFIVVGDPSPNGALCLMDRNGWAYADTEAVPVNELIDRHADHMLIIGSGARADTSAFRTISSTKEWRILRLTHE